MVVDDEKELLITYKIILENNGFTVDTFDNPVDALEKFLISDEQTYDLLLIDMIMQEMNGFELYNKLRNSDKKLPHICFISGYSAFYDTVKQSFPEIDVKCFIKKPVNANDLPALLKQELQKAL